MKILLLIEQLVPCSVVPFAMFLHPHSCRQMWRWQSWLWVCIVRSNWVETRLPADRWPSESQNFGIEAPPHLTDYPTQARITCTWTSNDHRSDVFQQWLVTSSVIFDYARSYDAQPNWKAHLKSQSLSELEISLFKVCDSACRIRCVFCQ